MKIELSFYGMDVALKDGLKDGLRKYLQKKGLQFTEFSLLDKQKKGKADGALVLAKKRLSGSIDQPESRIHFEHAHASEEGGTDAAEALRAFDAQIEHICRSVDVIANSIVAKHPEFTVVRPA